MSTTIGASIIGLFLSGTTLYELYNFTDADYDRSTGRLQGDTAYRLTSLGAAAIYVQVLAMADMLGSYYSRKRKGKETGGMRAWFWGLMMLFFVLTVTLGALDLHVVNHFDDVSIDISGDDLTGKYADALMGVSIAQLAVMVLAGGLWSYAYYKKRSSS